VYVFGVWSEVPPVNVFGGWSEVPLVYVFGGGLRYHQCMCLGGGLRNHRCMWLGDECRTVVQGWAEVPSPAWLRGGFVVSRSFTKLLFVLLVVSWCGGWITGDVDVREEDEKGVPIVRIRGRRRGGQRMERWGWKTKEE